MAKPIILTEALIEQMTKEFRDRLCKVRLSDGKLDYTRVFKYQENEKKVRLLFEPVAYLKMSALVDNFSTEVGWHGTVRREADDCFVITDIMVYPQTVTGATVNTDDESYAQWLMTIDNDTFNTMHFHGHSHVNMSTTPSGVDDAHREKILAQVEKDGFYIFVIWNKRGENNCTIYDMKTNTMYEDSDIEVGFYGDMDLGTFIKAAKEKVVTKAWTSSYGTGASTTTVSTGTNTTTVAKKTGQKTSLKKSQKPDYSANRYPGIYGSQYGAENVDYDDYVFGRGRVY